MGILPRRVVVVRGEKKSVLSCFVARVVYGIEREWRGFGTLRGLASNGELNGVQV